MQHVFPRRQTGDEHPALDVVAYSNASRDERLLACGIASAIVIFALGVIPFARVPAGELTSFLPALSSAGVVSTLLTAWLLYAQYRAGGSKPLAVLALAYGSAGALLVPYTMTFPHVFGEAGLLGAGTQTAAWLLVGWHLTFCAVVVLFVIAERNAARFSLRAASIGVGASLAGIVAATTLGHAALPVIVEGARFSAAWNSFFAPAVLGVVVLTAVLLISSTRLQVRCHLWLAIVLLALAAEIVIVTYEAGGRYTYGWYCGRAIAGIAFSVFLMMLQSQYTTVLRGLTLSNARLQGRNAQVEAFIALQDEVAAALPSRERVIAAVLKFAQRETRATGALLEVVNETEVFCEAAVGSLVPHIGSRLPRHATLSGLSASSRSPKRTDDTSTDDRVHRETCALLNMQSSIVVPIVVAANATVILKVSSDRPNGFDDDDVSALQLIATILSSGLRSAQEYAVLQTAERDQRLYARQLRALHVIASTTTDHRDEQIDGALRLALRQLALDWAYLGIIDEVAGEVIIERSVCRAGTPLLEAGARIPVESALVRRVTESEGVVVVRDSQAEDGPPEFEGWRSYIAVPLTIAGRRYGAIGCTSAAVGSEPFSQANIEFFAVAGELIASAIERGIKKQQLAESETRYRALTDAVPQLVWIIDDAGKLRYVNARWSTYTGLRLGQSAFFELECVIDSEYQSLLAGRGDAFAKEFECEARVRRFDGVYRWHLIRGVPFEDIGANAGRWIVTGTDIEERKLAEAAADDLHEAALAATEAKSRFLATMSHEIRTPMNGVIGMAELLLLTPLSDDQREHTKVVYESGQSLLRLLDDILDYSKIEAGKLEVEAVDLDLPAQLESVERLMRSQFEQKGVTLTSRVERNVPVTVVGDAGRLRQILINLVGNALKFTPTGGSVQVAVTSLGGEGEVVPVRFTIEDSGIGIAADVAERLFRPFTQGDGSTTRKYGGTGLGLSISAQLVALMNGTIGLESVPGKGSSFWFSIPFIKGGRSHLLPERALAPSDATPEATRSARILLVEDNEVNARVAIAQFKRIGFDISVAANGKLAVDAVRGGDFDLIFMDCQMPEMDGFAATREIRRMEMGTNQHVPIVAMTADARREDYTNCLATGMDDYLSKPTNLGQLQAVVERWLPAQHVLSA